MKKVLLGCLSLIIGLLFSGCMGAGYDLLPDNKEEISKNITIEHDSFKNQTWIRTPAYLIRKGITDRFPVIATYRAVEKANEVQFIQLYLQVKGTEWGFFNEAVGEDGYKFEFLKIDKDVNSYGAVKTGIVTIVDEDFGLSLSMEQLEKIAIKDYAIKIYGKKRQGEFTMPKHVSQAFLSKLKSLQK